MEIKDKQTVNKNCNAWPLVDTSPILPWHLMIFILTTRGLWPVRKYLGWICLFMVFGLRGHIIYLRQLFLTIQFFCHQGILRFEIWSQMDSSSPHGRNCGSQFLINLFSLPRWRCAQADSELQHHFSMHIPSFYKQCPNSR